MSFLNNSLMASLGIRFPFVQAPSSFSLFSPEEAAEISAHGGMGFLEVYPTDSVDMLRVRLLRYLERSSALFVCFMHQLPSEMAVDMREEALDQVFSDLSLPSPEAPSSFLDLLELVLSYQPKAIGFAAGLPERVYIEEIKAQGVLVFAFCHSVSEALVAQEFLCDFLVLQGLEAGGERFCFKNDLCEAHQGVFALLQQVRALVDLPLVLWGDFSHGADVVAALIAGAQGVVLDRAFLQCVLSEKALLFLASRVEMHSVEDKRYGRFKMRYFLPMEERLRVPELSGVWREALMRAYFAMYPEERPLPVSVSANDLPNAVLPMMEALFKEMGDLLE